MMLSLSLSPPLPPAFWKERVPPTQQVPHLPSPTCWHYYKFPSKLCFCCIPQISVSCVFVLIEFDISSNFS